MLGNRIGLRTVIFGRWQGGRQVIREYATTCLVLATLVGLGVWSHNQWPLPWKTNGMAAVGATGQGLTGCANSTSSADGSNLTNEPGSPTHVRFQSAAAVAKSGIEVVEAREQSISQYIAANGVVTYDQTLVAQLSARVPGTVWRVDKQVGQTVSKGDVLAIIEAVEVGRMKADFLQALVDKELKNETAKRLISAGTSVPERQVREANSALRESRIRLANAQQTLVNLGLPVHIHEVESLADDQLARAVQFLGLPESIAETLDPESTTANLLPLVAPFDGVVIGRDVTLGEVVSPSQPQIVVADVRRMWIKLDVQKENSSRLGLGQEVTFAVDGDPIPLVSKISWISTEMDEKTRTVQARVDVDNPLALGLDGQPKGQRLLRANAFGTGRIKLVEKPAAIVVPSEAVQSAEGRELAFVQVDDRTFEARAVTTGIASDGWVEILSGVAPGEIVVKQGAHLLKSELQRIELVARRS